MKTELNNLGPLVEASRHWQIDPEKILWLKQVAGRVLFSETEPDQSEFFAVLKTCTALEKDYDVDVTTCFVEWPTGIHDLVVPASWDDAAPYVGRPYVLGKWDCYTLAVDYMKREYGFNMTMLTETRERLQQKYLLDSLFEQNSEMGSWKRVLFPAPGDGILFCIGFRQTDVISIANHCGIYLGDDKFLHHLPGKSSCIETLDDKWKGWVSTYMRRKIDA